MKKIKFFLSLLLLAAFCRGEEISVEKPSVESLETLPAPRFLELIRSPFREQAWGEVTGRLTHKKGENILRSELWVRITFTEEGMFSQITQDKKNVYTMEQNHARGEKTRATISKPEKEQKPGLFDFGIAPADITFSFLYWDLLAELPQEEIRSQKCRIFQLKDPNSTDTVRVAFSAKHGFPLEAKWYRQNEKTPWRKLELKGAKRHANGLWFVREMRIEGKDWKTQIKFDFAELNPIR